MYLNVRKNGVSHLSYGFYGMKFDLKLSKKAAKNTRAIPTVKNENFKKSSENKMTLVKVVANDPSYCSNFFLF